MKYFQSFIITKLYNKKIKQYTVDNIQNNIQFYLYPK